MCFTSQAERLSVTTKGLVNYIKSKPFNKVFILWVLFVHFLLYKGICYMVYHVTVIFPRTISQSVCETMTCTVTWTFPFDKGRCKDHGLIHDNRAMLLKERDQQYI